MPLLAVNRETSEMVAVLHLSWPVVAALAQRRMPSPWLANAENMSSGGIVKLRCACVWLAARCPNDATQEDGLCDWCGTRRPEDMRTNPKAMHDPETGDFMALGGAGELHSNTKHTPDACWMPNSGRRVVRTPIPTSDGES